MGAQFPIQSIDFEQIQIQIQLDKLTADNVAPYYRSETARIKQRIAEAKARGEDHIRKAVVIVDGSVDLLPSAQIRKLQGDWMKENSSLLGLVVQAMAFVVPNSPTRGALTAVMWLAPMPFKVTTHDSMESALDWAITQVDRIGGVVPNELLLGGVVAIEKRRIQAEGVHRQWASARIKAASVSGGG